MTYAQALATNDVDALDCGFHTDLSKSSIGKALETSTSKGLHWVKTSSIKIFVKPVLFWPF